VFDIANFIFVTTLIGLLVPIVVVVIVLVAIVWTFRRMVPTGKAAAEQELRARMIRGEISPTEYEARRDAMRDER
jgi:uncharacterized membrane protein